MKSQLLLGFIILSMLIIPAYADELGIIKFSQRQYSQSEFPELILSDPDLNINSTMQETIEIKIWSDADVGGIRPLLIETGVDTGIFVGNFTLSTTEESKGNRIKIYEGDTITAEYEDQTLPNPPYSHGSELDIMAYAVIFEEDLSFKNIVNVTDIKLIDKFGYDVNIVNVDDTVRVSADLINNFEFEQIFTYLISINPDNSNKLAWITGSLEYDQLVSSSLSLIPETDGTYDITVMLFDGLSTGYRNLLAPTHNITFTTGSDSTVTNENDFTFNPNTENSPYSELTLNTNSEYYKNEIITITGNVPDFSIIGMPSVNLFIHSNPSIAYVETIPIKSDWTYEFQVDSAILIKDSYVVEINVGVDKLAHNISILPSQIQISTDKSLYYSNEIVTITGTMETFDPSLDATITWELYNENNLLYTNTDNTITDENFNFTFSTDILESSGLYDVRVTIQDTPSNRPVFEYDHNTNMDPEILYSMITQNSDDITINIDTIETNDIKVTEMMYDYDDKMNDINLDLENIKLQLNSMEEFHIVVNGTLGEYPPHLTENSMTKISGELDRMQREIDRTDGTIAEKLLDLEQARSDGNVQLTEKLEADLGSLILTREMKETQLESSNAYLEMYPQE